MLEDVLVDIVSLMPAAPQVAGVPAETLPLSYICSGLGAVILGKFTGTIGSITLPLNYSALFIGAILANWALGGVDLPIDHRLHEPLFFSIVGMLVGAFAMMWWLQGEHART
jgi:hypothetical protein